MTQPFDRSASLPALGRLDREAGQFWVENPWEFGPRNFNLSMYERNRVFLNAAGGGFVDVSHASGADSAADARAVVAADLDNDGMPDLLVRNSGGGPIQLFENRFPRAHYLKLSLRGTRSNRLGIGAGILAEAAGRKLWRELYPANSHMAQLPAQVLLGLGRAARAPRVERLTVYWPSGLTQQFTGLPANRHLRLTEGSPVPETIHPR